MQSVGHAADTTPNALAWLSALVEPGARFDTEASDV